MINEFVECFMNKKAELEALFRNKHPRDYTEVVKNVISILDVKDDRDAMPDADTIHLIDDGDYQGTQVFVIAEETYQPYNYWYAKIFYGSCSGCDTLQAINDTYDDEKPTDEQVKDYMTLALHVVQNLTQM